MALRVFLRRLPGWGRVANPLPSPVASVAAFACQQQQQQNSFSFSAPDLAKKKKLTNKDWVEKLTSEEYYVCREGGTEPPFTGKYVHNEEAGNYLCKCCKCELFSSDTKFESGTGWPSFFDAIYGQSLIVVSVDVCDIGTTFHPRHYHHR